jgi:hypothetical protein
LHDQRDSFYSVAGNRLPDHTALIKQAVGQSKRKRFSCR